MEYIGIQAQKRRNDFRSILLLFMFPCLVLGMVYIFFLLLAWLGFIEEAETEGHFWLSVNSVYLNSAPYVLGVVFVWFTIAYFLNTYIIKVSTGATTLERKKNKRVYNLVENLCMSQGMKIPKINIINKWNQRTDIYCYFVERDNRPTRRRRVGSGHSARTVAHTQPRCTSAHCFNCVCRCVFNGGSIGILDNIIFVWWQF